MHKVDAPWQPIMLNIHFYTTTTKTGWTPGFHIWLSIPNTVQIHCKPLITQQQVLGGKCYFSCFKFVWNTQKCNLSVCYQGWWGFFLLHIWWRCQAGRRHKLCCGYCTMFCFLNCFILIWQLFTATLVFYYIVLLLFGIILQCCIVSMQQWISLFKVLTVGMILCDTWWMY